MRNDTQGRGSKSPSGILDNKFINPAHETRLVVLERRAMIKPTHQSGSNVCPFSRGRGGDSSADASGEKSPFPESACPVSGAARSGIDHARRVDLAGEADSLCSPGQPEQSIEEVAREAWRESVRCIGRLHWKSLQVVDARAVEDADSVFEACVEHLRKATNGGRVIPTQTVFRPWDGPEREVRIWNPQLIRYAGYRKKDGSVVGDPAQVEFTMLATALGWRPPSTPGAFDVLPLIIQSGDELVVRELPEEEILEVRMEHPEHPWLEKLGLRWHAVPAMADMVLATGREVYGCAPFNGWYMGTEIGARNFGDEDRYNLLPVVAERMGLRQERNNLWKDRALLVLNEAVLHSFSKKGVRLVNHHQASKEFLAFCDQEKKAGREVQAEWSWIVPPLSGSATGVFHRTYEVHPTLPNLLQQKRAWETPRGRRLLARYL